MRHGIDVLISRNTLFQPRDDGQNILIPDDATFTMKGDDDEAVGRHLVHVCNNLGFGDSVVITQARGDTDK